MSSQNIRPSSRQGQPPTPAPGARPPSRQGSGNRGQSATTGPSATPKPPPTGPKAWVEGREGFDPVLGRKWIDVTNRFTETEESKSKPREKTPEDTEVLINVQVQNTRVIFKVFQDEGRILGDGRWAYYNKVTHTIYFTRRQPSEILLNAWNQGQATKRAAEQPPPPGYGAVGGTSGVGLGSTGLGQGGINQY